MKEKNTKEVEYFLEELSNKIERCIEDDEKIKKDLQRIEKSMVKVAFDNKMRSYILHFLILFMSINFFIDLFKWIARRIMS